MATTVYVTNPQLTTPGLPDELLLCYTIHVCVDGQPAVIHGPCAEETLVTVLYGDTGGVIKSAIEANIVAHIPNVSANDIIFIPDIGPGT